MFRSSVFSKMGAMASSIKKLREKEAILYDRRYHAVIKYLIRIGFPIHSAELFGNGDRTARLTAYLNLAVKYHFIPDAIQLISLGASVRARNFKGETALHFAVFNKRHVQLIEEIIPNGIRYRNMKFYGLECLRFATAARTSARAKNRIQELADTQVDSAPSHNLVKMLLDGGVDVNGKDANHCTPIQCAIYTGDVELVKSLIDAGADINNRNRIGATALHDAVLCCNEEMVLLLLSRGADVSIQTNLLGDTALHWASMLNIGNSQDGVIRRLLEFGSELRKPNGKRWTAFNCIVQCCDVNLVKFCIDEYKADLKQVAPGGNNALAFAAHNVDKNVLNLVLQESEIEINHKSKYGLSPLHYASQLSLLENVRRLISSGADVNADDDRGRSSLDKCIFMQYVANHATNLPFALQRDNYAEERKRVIRLLLESGSNVNQKIVINGDPQNKWSLLQLMIFRGEIEALNIIIEYAAEVEARSNKPLFDDYNLMLIDAKPEIKNFYQKCQAELTAMRSTKIGDTTICYFSVLTDPLDVVSRYARNKEFVKSFEAEDYQNAYVIYSSRLQEKFEAAIVRHKMFEGVSSTLSAILRFADPTHLAFEIIFEYLSEADVKSVISIAIA